jgi:RNA-directed DNA polymerase
LLENERLDGFYATRLFGRRGAPSASSLGVELVGRFSHGKNGSCQRLVDECNKLPCALLYGLAKLILNKLRVHIIAMRYDPVKIASGSIANLDSLCSALDITRVELDAALRIPGHERYSSSSTPKKDGSIRVVHNPHYLIRKIQRRINRRIFSSGDVIAWPDHIFGSIPNQSSESGGVVGKDYISCAQFHCEAKSVFTLDIKDFFDNVHQFHVKDVFLNFLKYDESVASALSDICCFESHLVQGALTSSYIACLCLYDVEGKIVEKLKRKNLVYTRLVDDINVSSKISDYDFSYAQSLIEGMLSEKGLPINRDKTSVQHISTKPLTVHGLRIAFKQPRLPSEEVRKIRAAVQNIERLSTERDYRTTHAYRKDFNRCMGRVNKLSRVGHKQHLPLLARLKKVFPLPSKKDIDRAKTIVGKLERDSAKKRDTYWYWRRFYLAHERLTILMRSFPLVATELREKLKALKPRYE